MLKLSVQKISLKPGVVFDRRVMGERFNYAQRVEEMPDDGPWFIDESGFNLHIAPIRCWSRVGKTPVVRVSANRGVNVSLLMCISRTGIIFFPIKVGSIKSDDFVGFLDALVEHFPNLSDGEICLVMDKPRILHAPAVLGLFARGLLTRNFSAVRFLSGS